ncbi:DUF7365 family protein [Streptococcus pyogenes]|uniref:DUF7365 family protein n=1 Tax=Streptococcus pyogenes TaxID=1314 RepID=UPI0016233D71|nr:hypothetical protein [Streptococcus pyogenes]QNF80531.1 hypothetical protein FNL90_06690 [Streptococcus pyogenes]
MATELIFGAGGFILPIGGIYTLFNAQSLKHEPDITLLQSEVEHLKIVTRQNARRLEEHAEQNKTLITMTEQIKNLTDDVKDLKDMMRGEIK